MQRLNRRITVVLFALVATAAVPGNCKEFSAVFDHDGQRVCAVGQPDEVRLSTNMATLECVRLCDDNPDCIVFNLHDNSTCEIFTCSSKLSRGYQIAESCKSFQINDCISRCNGPECGLLPRFAGFWPRDCVDVRASGHIQSGVYLINPGHRDTASSVYCDMNSSETWLVFQRRKDGSENFMRTWAEYAKGFGDLKGNEILYDLISKKNYKLRIDLEDFDGQKRYAVYANFFISSPSDFFRLNVAGYSGDAGDSMDYQNGCRFSTIDADHDNKNNTNCAERHRGAWWYNQCHSSNLNGFYLRGDYTTYADGVNWFTFRGEHYSLKNTEMKIAPVN